MLQCLPILVAGMVWLIVAFIIQTGSKNKVFEDHPDSFAAWVGAVCGIGVGLLTLVRFEYPNQHPVVLGSCCTPPQPASRVSPRFASQP